MTFEKDYYEFERFWNDPEHSYHINIEKVKITFDFIKPDVHSLLDAACGNGFFTNMAVEKYPNMKIVGFDRSATALKYVTAEKFIGNIDSIPFADHSFDCVVAHDVIEHLPVGVYESALREIARVAGKYIIIAVPYDENLEDNISQCPGCKSIFNNDLHMRSFDKEKMNDLFRDFDFSCVEIRTCQPNTFYVGQKLYGDIFYPKWKKKFRSPICPVCGYINPEDMDTSQTPGEAQTVKWSVLSTLKSIPKLLWPKYSKDYEMVALFGKN